MFTRVLVSLSILLCATANAHLCNNIFRAPDRVIVKPEKQSLTVEREDTFRVFVQNNYPAPLHNVRLSIQPDDNAVKVAVTPPSVQEIKAAQRTAFTVRVSIEPGLGAKKVALRFGFSAMEIDFRRVQECTNQELYERLPSAPNYGDNVLAAESLVRRKDPAGAKWLIEFMNNPRVRGDFRARAIRALGKAGSPEHAAPIKAFLDDRDGFLKGNALLALGRLKCSSDLFSPFLEEKDDFVRTCALAGLALAGQQDTLAKLKDGLASKDPYVQIACGWALAMHRDKDGVAALERASDTKNAMQLVMAGDALTDVAARDQDFSP